MALLALRYALTQDSRAADIVYAWFCENISIYSKGELETLLTFRSKARINYRAEFNKKEELWKKWAELLHSQWKTLE